MGIKALGKKLGQGALGSLDKGIDFVANPTGKVMNDIADSYIESTLGKRAQKHLMNGSVIKSNADAGTSMFGSLIAKSKHGGVIDRLTSNTGYRTVTDELSDSMVDTLDQLNLKTATDIATGAVTDEDGVLAATIARGTEMVNSGTYERGATGLEYVQGYYNDAANGKFRRNATIGAAAAIGVGGRFATGGSLTRNGDGRRDIIGVPFV